MVQVKRVQLTCAYIQNVSNNYLPFFIVKTNIFHILTVFSSWVHVCASVIAYTIGDCQE